MERVNLSSDNKLKDTWENTNLSLERDGTSGYSWPPRNYKCSFCKKEFKSAQALGGHMNVHRRDRAKLRLSPSWVDCPNRNPNPNFSSPAAGSFLSPYMNCGSSLSLSLSTCFSSATAASTKHEEKVPLTAHSHSLRDALIPRPQRRDMRKKMNMGSAFLGAGADHNKLNAFAQQEDEFRVLKKNDISTTVRLDLNMGLIREAAKEDLDLELRLGNS